MKSVVVLTLVTAVTAATVVAREPEVRRAMPVEVRRAIPVTRTTPVQASDAAPTPTPEPTPTPTPVPTPTPEQMRIVRIVDHFTIEVGANWIDVPQNFNRPLAEVSQFGMRL